MKRQKKLLQKLHCITLALLIAGVISSSLFSPDISFAAGLEERDTFEIFLEEKGVEIDLNKSITFILPDGSGFVLNAAPFYFYIIDTSETETLPPDNDTLGNTIIVSDTCEVIGILAVVLAASCLIYPNPILCSIAAAMQGIYRLLC